MPQAAAIVAEARMSMMGTLMSRDVGIEVRRPAATDDTATPRAFVAVDLLRLDGQSLLDVPLLERKRLLESVLDQGRWCGCRLLPTAGQWLGGLVAGRGVAGRHAEGGQWALHPGRPNTRVAHHHEGRRPSLSRPPGLHRRASGKVGRMPDHRLPPELRRAVDQLGSADIMVGIPSYRNAATIGHVARAAQAGLVQYFPDLRPVLVNADAGSPDGTGRVVVDTEPPDYVERILLVRPRNKLQRISLTYPEIDGVGGKGAALRTIFRIADALGVEALVVVDSDLRSIVPEWVELLAGPIVKGGFDFVAPLYSRYKWDGTITNTVTYPFTRALYGLRIRQPIGGDFGVSGDLIRHYLAQDDWTPDVSKFGIDIWMTTTAITGGFAVCQTRLGAKVHDPKDPGADLGPMFSQVVGTLLRLTDLHAKSWSTSAPRTTSLSMASSATATRHRSRSTSPAAGRVRRGW